MIVIITVADNLAAGIPGRLNRSTAVVLVVLPVLRSRAYVSPTSSGSTTLGYDIHRWQYVEAQSC